MSLTDSVIFADLALLDDALNDPDVDLRDLFRQFDTAIRAAVASYCGLSITVATDGNPVTLTSLAALDEGTLNAGAVTSLGIPLGVVTAAATGEIVLFARTPGAFVDLAADLAYTDHFEVGVLALDAHLAPAVHGVPAGVARSAMVTQAIGALIERGLTPEQASAFITRSAIDKGQHVFTSAVEILDAVVP